MKGAVRTTLLTLMIGLPACNSIFGLQSTVLPDSPPDVDCSTVTPDEDGDCVADDADNCPGIANTDQLDLDMDGVGEACDPRPGLAGDAILLFDSFNDTAASQQRWRDVETGMPDQWIFEPGRVRHPDVNDTFSILQSTMPIDLDEDTVEVGFDFVDWKAGSFPLIWIVSDAKRDLPDGSHCQLTDAPPPASYVNLQEYDLNLPDPNNGDDTRTRIFFPPDRPLPMVLTLRRSTTSGELECGLRYGLRKAAPGNILRAPAGRWPADRYVGIYLDVAAINIKWITIYRVP